ncbi:hypothetical protein LSH36_3g27023 [Paralvinella palmiformis]|uniref:Sushi domain-containing protein n=1 Tax=Paralvinella palmiformis TaxID=53620 RepID=A0AAD9KFJ3_9ANNE|nr:hypothetical protein LSH36_3g27023 [Paralvinella palmiformis]
MLGTVMTTCPVPETASSIIFVASTQNKSHDAYPLATELTYGCRNGYSLKNGVLTRLCTENGTWSGSTPVCTKIIGKDNYMNTILIASGSTVLACVLFFFIFLIDFHFYKKKKHRNKIIRSQGHIKSGQNRPTSFIISKERHKLLSLYMSPHYREPQTTRTDTKQLQRTLDSDINRALDPGHGSVVTRKASKGKRTKNKGKVTSDSIEVATQTDNSLMDTTLNGATVTRSGARRKKKKRHQIEPMAKNDGILQPMSLSLNGNIPILAKPSGDAAMVRYPDDYRDTHGWGIPFDDPLGDHYAPEVSRQPVRQVRRLPPRPGSVSGGYRGESAEQEISMVDETAYRFQQHALSS